MIFFRFCALLCLSLCLAPQAISQESDNSAQAQATASEDEDDGDGDGDGENDVPDDETGQIDPIEQTNQESGEENSTDPDSGEFDVFKPSEDIAEDLSVPFPVDI